MKISRPRWENVNNHKVRRQVEREQDVTDIPLHVITESALGWLRQGYDTSGFEIDGYPNTYYYYTGLHLI